MEQNDLANKQVVFRGQRPAIHATTVENFSLDADHQIEMSDAMTSQVLFLGQGPAFNVGKIGKIETQVQYNRWV